MNIIKWLYPGMRVKRWLALGLAGLLMIITGSVHLIGGARGWELAAALFSVTAGFVVVFLALRKAFLSVMETLAPQDNLVEKVFNHRQLEKGPKIVVIGGGTGLSVLLRGLKEYTSNLTAIVTVADDGGSSGRLRGDLGMLPPGDVRNCLVALADKEPLMEELLQYRFPTGELAGHNLGNLLLAALNNMKGGFNEAIKALSRVLAIRGQVLPVTLEDVCLCAEMEDGEVVRGESQIPKSGKKISRVFLKPEVCYPVKEALQAIECADAVILGPGSLYTSVLPNLLVQGVTDALANTRATKIYVCNIMTQPGETDGYSASDHVKAIYKHSGLIVDWIVVNKESVHGRILSRYRKEGAVPVRVDEEEIAKLGINMLAGYMLQENGVLRHRHDYLASYIMNLIMPNRDKGKRVVIMNNYKDEVPVKKAL